MGRDTRRAGGWRGAGAAAIAAVLLSAASPACADDLDTATVDAPRELAWSRLIEYLASAGLMIRTIDRESGVVFVDEIVHTGDEFRGWGWGRCQTPFWPDARVITTLNVFLRADGPDRTIARVTAVHTHQYEALLTGRHRREACQSTGRLERTIFSALAGED